MSNQWTENATTIITVEETDFKVYLTGKFSRERVGEDADGNRGWDETFCDDRTITDIDPVPTEDQLNRIEQIIYDEMDCDDFDWDKGGGL